MIIKNIKNSDIEKNKKLSSNFFSVNNKQLKIDCKFYKGIFFIDSFNYFPISEKGNVFEEIFSWGDKSKYNIFKKKFFSDNFQEKKNQFKNFSNSLILGSSSNDNYYSNIINFFPRIFFINSKNINLVIHRKSSNKFRNFVEEILKKRKVTIDKFIYLDDNYYKFIDSEIPQFFPINISIKILNNYFSSIKTNKKLKIYVSRQNANYRNLINEDDIIEILKRKGFKIIDTNKMNIFEQIKFFSSAEVVISPTGSALTNTVFCQKNTKVVEISPRYQFQYENIFKNRYSEISKNLNLIYKKIEADPVSTQKSTTQTDKFISKDVFSESNYYKNLLVQKSKIEKLIEKL